MWCLWLVACASPSSDRPDTARSPLADSAADSAPEQVGAADPSAAVYDVDTLHRVEITLAEDDWETLRNESRSLYDMLDGDCLAEAWEAPYTEYPAEVVFDGEPMGTVGLRKKGLIGSASTERPSLRIDTDEYTDGSHFHGLEKLVLNNNNQDESRVRTCFAHDFFGDAGLVAPRCSLALVTVNGESLGIYDNTESIDADLIERVRGAPPTTLYEGRLSDFRDGWLGSFEAKTETSDGADLAAVLDALDADDDVLLERLDTVMDVDAFLRFWAAEGVAGHWDGYAGNTNNFYVYGDPSDGRLQFIAAGPDAAFDRREPFGSGQPVWVATAGALANRLIQIPEAKQRYTEMVQSLLDERWLVETRLAQLDAWADLLHDETSRDERSAMQDLQEIVEARASDIEDQLGEEVEASSLRSSPCFVEVGTVAITFSTTFGTYPDGDLYTAGDATTWYEIDDVVYTSLQDGVSVGDYGDGRILWLTISQISDDVWLAPYVLFDPAGLADDTEVPIDGYAAEAALLYNAPETGGEWYTAAYLGDGALVFTTGSSIDGATVAGELNLSVLTSGG